MKRKLLIIFPLFIFFAALSYFGIQFVLKTGIFKVPGELVFAEDFPESEKEYYINLFAETELDYNLDLKIVNSLNRIEEEPNKNFLLDIVVPITDFYNPETVISSEEFEKLYNNSSTNVISVLDLDNKSKLLALDNEENYFLETFSSGALFKYLEITSESEKPSEDIEKAKSVIAPTLKTFPEKSTTLSLVQTGVTALSRGMNAKLYQVGDATYFSENIAPFLKSFDLAHTSNEASFTNLATKSNICSDPAMIDVLTDSGIDIVELTGNHNQDCGITPAKETIDLYQSLNIKTVGGGKNATEAAIPLKITEKGNGITLLAYNQSTGGATYGETPGANQYYESDAEQNIKEAKERGDIVIVDIQYYECNAYDSATENTTCDYANSSAGDQIGLFRRLIDMGADIVVGTSAHQTQTYEQYGDGVIYYGLGNLFFDQIWWPGTTRSLALAHYFYNGKILQTRLRGTVYDSTMQTRLMNKEELAWFIERLNRAR